jgi:hypothetical protein
MTAEQFNKFWTSAYPGTVPISHHFKHDYEDRWFRIHSLPESKRYADNEKEWEILLDRQNKIITDILGDCANVLLVTGDYSSEGNTESSSPEATRALAGIVFIPLDPIDLNKLNEEDYDAGQLYQLMFSEQIWQPHKFDALLKAVADDQLRFFFISIENRCIIAPYDGGIDFILKDQETKNMYKERYKEWLSARQDGL